MVRKNRMETTALITWAPAPILAKMKGRVSNTNPGPELGVIPAANTAGITANPARMANNKSKNAVPVPDRRIFSSFLT